MRDNLEDTVEAFNASVGSVERSFLSKARKLVGAECGGRRGRFRKSIPIDERLRGLEAIELRAELGDTPMLEGLILEPSDQEP